MLYRDFLKGLAIPLAVCVLACAAFLHLALPILVLCAACIVVLLGFSVWRLLLARQNESFRKDADSIDREASVYWLGTLIGSLLAPMGYLSFTVYALRPMHYTARTTPFSEAELAQAACPLQFFVDGLPANFFGTIVHDRNTFALVIHGCPQRVELEFPDHSSNARLVAFQTKLDERATSSDGKQYWKYEPEVNVTGELSVRSQPAGFRKDESGRVYDGSGKFVGDFFDQHAAKFTFTLSVSVIEDLHSKNAVAAPKS